MYETVCVGTQIYVKTNAHHFGKSYNPATESPPELLDCSKSQQTAVSPVLTFTPRIYSVIISYYTINSFKLSYKIPDIIYY